MHAVVGQDEKVSTAKGNDNFIDRCYLSPLPFTPCQTLQHTILPSGHRPT